MHCGQTTTYISGKGALLRKGYQSRLLGQNIISLWGDLYTTPESGEWRNVKWKTTLDSGVASTMNKQITHPGLWGEKSRECEALRPPGCGEVCDRPSGPPQTPG